MLSIAAGLAESIEFSYVAIANHLGDHAIYSDCREDYIAAMGYALYLGTSEKVRIYAPFTRMMKWDVCKIGDDNLAPLSDTWSCYEGDWDKGHCSSCGTCFERIEAFQKAGVKDETHYQVKSEEIRA
jgi:7-cyano-7-deazaguanine synthase